MTRLSARVAIVTGAVRGIGAEFACGLAAEGAPRVGAFRRKSRWTAYAASKGAVLVNARSVARELGDYNICVNAIAPGFTESEGVMANKNMSQALKDMQIRMRSFKRVMQVNDLTGTLVYLASGDSNFVTGQTILVDGGAINH